MKTNAMTIAWKIRKDSAKRLCCKVMDIDFSECLKMAWVEFKNADLFDLFSRASKLCVTGAAGLKKLGKSTGKTDVLSAIKYLENKFKKSNTCKHDGYSASSFGLFLNLEINKL